MLALLALLACKPAADEPIDRDGDLYTPLTDCDDENPDIHPGARESCDGVDEDCDGEIDEGVPAGSRPFHADVDGDGFGDAASQAFGCSPPAGYVDDESDCDDGDAGVHPGADEVCDGADQDCDGWIDEDPADGSTFFADTDHDGYGDEHSPVVACEAPEFTTARGGDCDDTLATVFPGAPERCDAADRDEDCDGLAEDDDPDSTGQTRWYRDLDGDGYGDDGVVELACDGGAGWVAGPGDCVDDEPDVHPGAVEVCENGVDDDCDGGALGCGLAGWIAAADVSVRLHGLRTGDRAGEAVADGDLDGDGASDLAIGLPGFAGSGRDRGLVAVVDPAAVTSPFDLTTAGVRLEAPSDGEEAGGALAIGDLDGDGSADLVVGAEGAASSRGRVYVVSGPLSGVLNLRSAGAELDWEVPGAAFGTAVAVLDLDGDGVDDVVAGAPTAVSGAINPGAVAFVRGPVTSGGTASAWLAGDDDGGRFGQALADVGDLDGDGLDDLAIGAPRVDDSGADRGLVAVVLGGSSPAKLADADALLSGERAGDRAGGAVAAAGDHDGDGYADLVVGAAEASAGAKGQGVAYLVRGPVSGAFDLAGAEARLLGASADDAAGTSVGGGDHDGDGHPDLVVGAFAAEPTGTVGGAVYLVYGPTSGAVDLALAGGTITPEGAGTELGTVTLLTDLDGDGRAEVVAGAPYGDGLSSRVGNVLVVWGGGGF